MKYITKEQIEVFKSVCFIAESVAHLQGKERDILPSTDSARAIIATLESQPETDRSQLFKDTLTTAAEGGIGYWCFAERIERDDDRHVINIVGPQDVEDEATKWEDITLDVVKRGFERIITGQVKVRRDIFDTIVGDWHDPEGCRMDAEAADCVVQAGLFNELVYG